MTNEETTGLTYYNVDMYYNYAIVLAKNLRSAKSWANQKLGSYNIHYVREASEDEVVWFKHLGGRVENAEA